MEVGSIWWNMIGIALALYNSIMLVQNTQACLARPERARRPFMIFMLVIGALTGPVLLAYVVYGML
jgi:hypothetical protein